jgi:hypothetical protein
MNLLSLYFLKIWVNCVVSNFSAFMELEIRQLVYKSMAYSELAEFNPHYKNLNIII